MRVNPFSILWNIFGSSPPSTTAAETRGAPLRPPKVTIKKRPASWLTNLQPRPSTLPFAAPNPFGAATSVGASDTKCAKVNNVLSSIDSLRNKTPASASPTPAQASIVPEVEMSDAPLPTPPSTPPLDGTGERTNKRSASETFPDEEIFVREKPYRATRQPVRQENRQAPSRHDFENDVFMEDDDGTLPDGYVGTFESEGVSERFYKPTIDDSVACGNNGLHELGCGHWILDSTKIDDPGLPCGLNCKKASLDTVSFNCSQCKKLVMDVLNDQLTLAEKRKLDQAKAMGEEIWVASYIIEFVTQRSVLKRNVTETVMAIVKDDYGRNCHEASAPEPIEYFTPAELLRKIEETRARDAFEKKHEAVRGVKRGHMTPSKTPTSNGASASFNDTCNRKRVRVDEKLDSRVTAFDAPQKRKMDSIINDETFAEPQKRQMTQQLYNMRLAEDNVGDSKAEPAVDSRPVPPSPHCESDEDEW